jgi:hypothetical protein
VRHNTHKDPIDLRRQQQEAERLERAAEAKRQRDVEDFKSLMKLKEGRRFVWRLLSETGVYHSSFTGNSETFFKEGRRSIGLILIGELHTICPELYAVMVEEHQQDDN